MIYECKPEVEALQRIDQQIAAIKTFLRTLRTINTQNNHLAAAIEYLELAAAKLKVHSTSRWLELEEAARWPTIPPAKEKNND